MNTLPLINFEEVFYKLCYQFVKYYPNKSDRCKRLNCFVAATDQKEINTPNFSRISKIEKGKNYFWSRDWQKNNFSDSHLKKEYPILVAMCNGSEYDNIFKKVSTDCFSIELLILDVAGKLKDEKNKLTYCDTRTINEIYLDTKKFMKELLSYLKNIIYVNGTLVNGDFIGFINKDLFNALIDAACVSETYTIDKQKTNIFSAKLQNNNSKVTLQKYDLGYDDAHGTLLELTLCTEECIEEYDTNFSINKNEKSVPDKFCC